MRNILVTGLHKKSIKGRELKVVGGEGGWAGIER
jgi:hypothetical protein